METNISTVWLVHDLGAAVKTTGMYGLNGYAHNNSTYVTYMNNQNNSIYIMNFEEPESLPKVIPLNDSVLNKEEYGYLHNFIIKGNKLAFLQEQRFGIYNLDQHELEFDHANAGTDDFPFYFNFTNVLALNHVDSTKELYMQYEDFREEERDYIYDRKLHCKMNVSTGEISLLPVKFPKSWGNGELGMSAFVSCLYKGDSIIYNFSNEDHLVIYDEAINKLTKVNSRSQYHKEANRLNPDDINDIDKNRELKNISFVYNNLLFNPWKNCYYRIYSKDQAMKDEEGYFNTGYDRKEGVMVLDNEFNLIGEFEIPNRKAHTFFVTKKGLAYMLPKAKEDSSFVDYLKFKSVEIIL